MTNGAIIPVVSIQGIGRDVKTVIELLKDMESAEQQERWDMTVETLQSLLRDINR